MESDVTSELWWWYVWLGLACCGLGLAYHWRSIGHRPFWRLELWPTLWAQSDEVAFTRHHRWPSGGPRWERHMRAEIATYARFRDRFPGWHVISAGQLFGHLCLGQLVPWDDDIDVVVADFHNWDRVTGQARTVGDWRIWFRPRERLWVGKHTRLIGWLKIWSRGGWSGRGDIGGLDVVRVAGRREQPTGKPGLPARGPRYRAPLGFGEWAWFPTWADADRWLAVTYPRHWSRWRQFARPTQTSESPTPTSSCPLPRVAPPPAPSADSTCARARS